MGERDGSAEGDQDGMEPAGPAAATSLGDALALHRLGLPSAGAVLLCAPDAYIDCSAPVVAFAQLREPQQPAEPKARSALQTRLVAAGSSQSASKQVLRLRFTGQARAFDAVRDGAELSPWTNALAWRDVRRVDLQLTDVDGLSVRWSVFGDFTRVRGLNAGQDIELHAAVRWGGRDGAVPRLEAVEEVPPQVHERPGSVWVRYSGIPGSKLAAAARVQEHVERQLAASDPYSDTVRAVREATGSAGDALRADSGFASIEAALEALHRPTTVAIGRRALALAKAWTIAAIKLQALRAVHREPHEQAPLAVQRDQAFASIEPRGPTRDQRQALESILSALQGQRPAHVLLAGDVATGKTLVYAAAAAEVQRVGGQVAIMAPTTPLADQIAMVLAAEFRALGVAVERVEAGRRIQNPQAVLVGTVGLIGAARKSGYVPNLLVLDEQHRLGAKDREALVGPWTHVVEVTATPVPRSLAATAMAGRLVLNLCERPRPSSVVTHLGGLAERPFFAELMRKAVAAGESVIVVYPRVGGDGEEAASVQLGASVLERAFPGKVAVAHGRMKRSEVDASIEQIRRGDRAVLVATTLVEAGLDLPRVGVVVARDAQQFGVAQLHQMRGRVARGGGEGRFLMMVPGTVDELEPTAKARLQLVARTNDGLLIAEADLQARGLGDLAGSAQSGSCPTLFKQLHLGLEDLVAAELKARAAPMPPPGEIAPSTACAVSGSKEPGAADALRPARQRPVYRTLPRLARSQPAAEPDRSIDRPACR